MTTQKQHDKLYLLSFLFCAALFINGCDGLQSALRLGTNDAKIFYHAAMIARASGDEVGAADDFLQRALKLNPQFDPLQSAIAKTLPESR